MFRGGAHAVALDAPDHGSGHHTGDQRIFGVVFEVAPAEGIALDVKGGAQQHIGAVVEDLAAHGLTHLFDQPGIPGGGHEGTDGKGRTEIGAVVALSAGRDSQSGRAIGQYLGGYPQVGIFRGEACRPGQIFPDFVDHGRIEGVLRRPCKGIHHSSAGRERCRFFRCTGGAFRRGIPPFHGRLARSLRASLAGHPGHHLLKSFGKLEMHPRAH